MSSREDDMVTVFDYAQRHKLSTAVLLAPCCGHTLTDHGPEGCRGRGPGPCPKRCTSTLVEVSQWMAEHIRTETTELDVLPPGAPVFWDDTKARPSASLTLPTGFTVAWSDGGHLGAEPMAVLDEVAQYIPISSAVLDTASPTVARGRVYHPPADRVYLREWVSEEGALPGGGPVQGGPTEGGTPEGACPWGACPDRGGLYARAMGMVGADTWAALSVPLQQHLVDWCALLHQEQHPAAQPQACCPVGAVCWPEVCPVHEGEQCPVHDTSGRPCCHRADPVHAHATSWGEWRP